MLSRRRSGILLHPTSLPGPEGIGCFGDEARRFVDFLAEAGQTVWQVLPLNIPGYGDSPYSCYSTFAGNHLLIDLRELVFEGDLPASALDKGKGTERVDYDAVRQRKERLLRQAAATFLAEAADERKREFWDFCDTTVWLHDYALFMALKEHFPGKNWSEWPEEISRRTPEGFEKYSVLLGDEIGQHKYLQWRFFRQWLRLKEYANGKGIVIFGDIPIFVAYDSSDVWANPQLFHLDENRRPRVVAGVPPDYFSATGQLWGNPLYDWEASARDGHGWWVSRFRTSLALYDIFRIDHFRAFAAYWEVPASEKTAMNGQWVPGPGGGFFEALLNAVGTLPIVAEDLGTITPDVEELRDRFNLPGMKVLQFAFDSGPTNPYLPHNYLRESVVYTGTHDNDTTVGWFSNLTDKQRRRILTYINSDGSDIAWELIRVALSSVSRLAIIPLQDVLSLGSEAKMNLPGTASGNWSWRLQPGALTKKHAERLRELTELFGRGVKQENS